MLGGMFLAAATFVTSAQAQYAPYPYPYGYFTGQAPATPPSWSYDPYTSGLAGCPQWYPGETPDCRKLMPPTYGQPDFWPR